VLLLGLVSLLADMTYEGARSVTGPFLQVLGANGTTVGIVAGFGELLGYGFRLVSGYWADKTGRYWTFTMAGYALNLLSVPLLALAGWWQIAALLIIAERMGKAIRTPARDAMLSYATHQTGRGWGFGLHEAMDQIGAVTGPLFVAAALFLDNGYRASFALLLIPALLALGVLTLSRYIYPRPRDFEIDEGRIEGKGLPRRFWLYVAAVGLVAAGYVDFPIIAFHFQRESVVSPVTIPLLYALAMGTDAVAALAFGRLFDRFGISVLVVAVASSAFVAPLVFWGSFGLIVVGTALWGIGMGAQESIMRAVVADMVPVDKRAGAYGVFNMGYGVLWFGGSALIGVLYDVSLPALISFSVLAQVASIPILLSIARMQRPKRLASA
jgi:MFS family permease